jgi:hypothetical protein
MSPWRNAASWISPSSLAHINNQSVDRHRIQMRGFLSTIEGVNQSGSMGYMPMRSRICLDAGLHSAGAETEILPDLACRNVGGLRGIEKKVHHAKPHGQSHRPTFRLYPAPAVKDAPDTGLPSVHDTMAHTPHSSTAD